MPLWFKTARGAREVDAAINCCRGSLNQLYNTFKSYTILTNFIFEGMPVTQQKENSQRGKLETKNLPLYSSIAPSPQCYLRVNWSICRTAAAADTTFKRRPYKKSLPMKTRKLFWKQQEIGLARKWHYRALPEE